ncbi:MAG TPA: hypothetical protein VD884_13470 [Ohtaekwangia sp.]|nr:hypothetical protein [Ohtaekwangia sp.]
MEDHIKNITRLERLLESKDFDSLTPEERQFVLSELGSAAQYALMKKVGQALVSEKAGLLPDPLVHQKLKEALHLQRQTIWRRIVSIQLPAYVAVLLMTISAAVMSMVVRPSKPSVIVSRVVKTDTLFVPVKPDTVFVERVVIKYVPAKDREIEPYSVAKTNFDSTDPVVTESVNMKEKEELDNLLVTGS